MDRIHDWVDKFTHEEEKDGKIPFLDTLIIRKSNGAIKLLVYRKPTHTDQYLNFSSEHPLHQKMGVIRTLFDRMNSVVTEEDDRLIEEERVRAALRTCGYPEWAMNKVKEQMANKNQVKAAKKAKPMPKEKQSKGMVVIPYVNGLSERIQRVYKKHNVEAAMKPHSTLRNLLVHPKDKREKLQCSNVIYEIGCKNCDHSYVGETSRLFGVRLSEHQTEVKKASEKKFTRSERRASEQEQTKSAISDHVARANHIINWEEAKILGKEHNKKAREIKEAIAHILTKMAPVAVFFVLWSNNPCSLHKICNRVDFLLDLDKIYTDIYSFLYFWLQIHTTFAPQRPKNT